MHFIKQCQFLFLIKLPFLSFSLQKKEPVGDDESIPEDVLNFDDLTADTLAVGVCPLLRCLCSFFTLIPGEKSWLHSHAALWQP